MCRRNRTACGEQRELHAGEVEFRNIANAVIVAAEFDSLTHRARILWIQGFGDQAAEAAEEACLEALSTDQIRPTLYALSYAGCAVALWTGDLQRADRHIETLREGTVRYAMPFWQIWAQIYAHASMIRRADSRSPRPISALQGLNAVHEDMLATLGIERCAPSALARALSGDSAWCAPEIIRVAGEQLRFGPDKDVGRAEGLLAQSLRLAEQQQALGWALRSSASLAALRYEDGRATEARTLLASTLDRFTEGFETQDFLAARRLLGRIESGNPSP